MEYNGVSDKPSIVIRNNFLDTSIWDDIELKDNDIFVNTPAKAGTTWTQEIVGQLLYNGDYQNKFNVSAIVELSVWPAIAALPYEMKIKNLNDQLQNEDIGRRIIKTHEPVESMPFNPNSKYIFVGRDYRDIVWSLHNFGSIFSEAAWENFEKERYYEFTRIPRFDYENGMFLY